MKTIYTSAFKAQVVLELLKEEKTITSICMSMRRRAKRASCFVSSYGSTTSGGCTRHWGIAHRQRSIWQRQPHSLPKGWRTAASRYRLRQPTTLVKAAAREPAMGPPDGGATRVDQIGPRRALTWRGTARLLFYIIPEQTIQAARAAFPKGNPYMQMRDTLGPIYTNPRFRRALSQDRPTGRSSRTPGAHHGHAVCRRAV